MQQRASKSDCIERTPLEWEGFARNYLFFDPQRQEERFRFKILVFEKLRGINLDFWG